MGKLYTRAFALFMTILVIALSNVYSQDNSERNLTVNGVEIDAATEQMLHENIATWATYKDKELDPTEFGLFDNDKARLFLIVYHTLIKDVKININNEAYYDQHPEIATLIRSGNEKAIIELVKDNTLELLSMDISEIMEVPEEVRESDDQDVLLPYQVQEKK